MNNFICYKVILTMVALFLLFLWGFSMEKVFASSTGQRTRRTACVHHLNMVILSTSPHFELDKEKKGQKCHFLQDTTVKSLIHTMCDFMSCTSM